MDRAIHVPGLDKESAWRQLIEKKGFAKTMPKPNSLRGLSAQKAGGNPSRGGGKNGRSSARDQPRLRADRPIGSVSPAFGPGGIPWDDRVRAVGCRPSRIRIDEHQTAERTLNKQLVRILRGDEERALACATHYRLLVHVDLSGICYARFGSVMRGRDVSGDVDDPQLRARNRHSTPGNVAFGHYVRPRLVS